MENLSLISMTTLKIVSNEIRFLNWIKYFKKKFRSNIYRVLTDMEELMPPLVDDGSDMFYDVEEKI